MVWCESGGIGFGAATRGFCGGARVLGLKLRFDGFQVGSKEAGNGLGMRVV